MRIRVFAIGMIVALAATACGGGGRRGAAGVAARGPGLKQADAAALTLPVLRTFDLTHVRPEHFAAALGNDPVRIFEFVRDTIAFEAYPGWLRGARGTLLALAGNAIDRTLLLSAMLVAAGQQVRYVRGTLSEKDATDLVLSMWAERPQVALDADDDGARTRPAAEAWLAAVERDYLMLRDVLKTKVRPTVRPSTPAVEALAQEAREHYWVQWMKDGSWTDLDPSFPDAVPGRTYAADPHPFESAPEPLLHGVTIRVVIEEYTGGTPARREVLSHSMPGSDLAATDLLLLHLPENWTGPAASLGQAISSAIEETGRIRPVLVVEEQPLMGEVFRQRLKTAGIGAVGDLLSGEGTRRPAALATAEWLEIEFGSPGGPPRTVTREIFDLIGPAERAAGRVLTAEEVRARTDAEHAPDLTADVYDLIFTTGAIHAAHLQRLAPDATGSEGDHVDIRTALWRLGVGITATSDRLLGRLGRPDRAVVVSYPDSPRLVIADLAVRATGARIALDLRSTDVRLVANGPHPEDAYSVRLLRGVAEGALERVLVEDMTEGLRRAGWGTPVTTSTIFGLAAGQRVPALVLPQERGRLAAGLPADALARLEQDTAQGLLAVAPQRAVEVNAAPRYAWWRIDPAGGRTTAVTDEGLHAAVATEYKITEGQNGRVTVQVRYVRGRPGYPRGVAVRNHVFDTSVERGMLRLGRFVRGLMRHGATPVRGRGLGSLPVNAAY